jgi:hypothetical protein
MADKVTPFTVSDKDFDSDLTFGGAGVAEKINMYSCATPAAAARLQTHLASIGLDQFIPTHDWPLGRFVAGSSFAQSGKVPYMNFPQTVKPVDDYEPVMPHVNVADLLLIYTRYPLATADALILNKYGPAQT